MKIHIGNLSLETTEDQLRGAFQAFGKVTNVKIIHDRNSGQSRGFGFVEMPAEREALAAIKGLNKHRFHGRAIDVNEAKARPRSGNREGGNHYNSEY